MIERYRNGDVGECKDDLSCFGTDIARKMIEEETLGKNGKVQCWKVMMNVQHSGTKIKPKVEQKGGG